MDMHDIAEILSPARQSLRVRQAAVLAINAGGTVDVTIAGSEVVVAGVKVMDHVTPVVGRSLWLLTDGVDLIGIGVT